MALDTATKRANAMQVGRPFIVALPVPDGVIGQANRWHLGMSYLIGLFPSDIPTIGWTINWPSRVWTVTGNYIWSVKS